MSSSATPLCDRTWMLYGANGYTGGLIAAAAAERRCRPILAGRRSLAVEALARRLDLPSRCFALDDPGVVRQALDGCWAVLNCAGPFAATARPLIDACLAVGVHYLDITGEIDVIEAAAASDQTARRAGVTLLPAVGFDVVPTDCLASRLAAALPTATHLRLAFTSSGGISPGTLKTSLAGLAQGGRARVDGTIVTLADGWTVRRIPFRQGTLTAVRVPWGDVASAYYSTGIGNIETYMAMPWPQRVVVRLLRKLLTPPLLRKAAMRLVDWGVKGPPAQRRARSRASIWGQASDADGRVAEATLETSGGYVVTVDAALLCLQRLASAPPGGGFFTPSSAFGSDLVLEVPGTSFRWERRP